MHRPHQKQTKFTQYRKESNEFSKGKKKKGARNIDTHTRNCELFPINYSFQRYNYWVFFNIICATKIKIKLFESFKDWTNLELFKNLLHEDLIFFDLEWFFKCWVVANHKLSNYSAFNSNPRELPIKNILNPYLGKMDCYA
jgi:hypothetical protein